MQIVLTVNEKRMEASIRPEECLADVLRNNGLLSIRKGCNTSSCGLCTVWMDGKPVLSCTIPAARAQGRHITTIEGVANEAEEFARFLVSEGAEQCGFCSPGFIMTVLAMKNELKDPTLSEIEDYLTGNLCRCTGYKGQLRAVESYMRTK